MFECIHDLLCNKLKADSIRDRKKIDHKKERRSRQGAEKEEVGKKNLEVLVGKKKEKRRFGSNKKKTLKREYLNIKKKSLGFFSGKKSNLFGYFFFLSENPF